MKNKRKTLGISIEYTDTFELKQALLLIEKEILAKETNHNAVVFNNITYEWQLRTHGYEAYTETEIRGVWHCVYKSKFK